MVWPCINSWFKFFTKAILCMKSLYWWCHGHGNFLDDFLRTFSFLHVHAPYPPFHLLMNLGETPEDKTNTEIRTADNDGTQTRTRDTIINCPGTPPKTPPPSRPPSLVRDQEQLLRIPPQHRPLGSPLAPATPPLAMDLCDSGTPLH